VDWKETREHCKSQGFERIKVSENIDWVHTAKIIPAGVFAMSWNIAVTFDLNPSGADTGTQNWLFV